MVYEKLYTMTPATESNPGTGKTHLSVAVALRALSKNFKVLFTPVSELLYQLHALRGSVR